MKKIQADLLDFPEGINVIFHQANTEGVMGAGIAKQIRKRFPTAWENDKSFSLPFGEDRLGHFSYYELQQVREEGGRATLIDKKIIINLYGQMLNKDSVFGIATDYLALYAALSRACNWLEKRREEPVMGFPYGMGCGLGGGEWSIVEEIIERTTKNNSVYIVEKI